MAKRLSIREQLSRLALLAETASRKELQQEVCAILEAEKELLLVKSAIKLVLEHRFDDLAPQMANAFERFMINPLKTDRLCDAKSAIVDVLDQLGCAAYDVFLRGVRHVQILPGGDEPVDAAEELRARCALALVRQSYPTAAFVLAELLVDFDDGGVALALTELGGMESESMLRLRLRMGKLSPVAQDEYFSALMRIAPGRSLAFVASYLKSHNALTVEGAALALGESHLPEAFTALRSAWDKSCEPECKKAMLLGMGLVRSEEAVAFLLRVIATEYEQMALGALDALRLYRGDPTIVERIARAVETRGIPSLKQAFAE